MNKILVIAPYEGLKELFHEIIIEYNMKNIDVCIGELKHGVEIAKEMEKKGYDVIVSRGATAKVIRQAVNIPVIEVQISGYDILRTIQIVNGFNGKIGIMSYLNVISGMEEVGKLLNMNFSLYPILDECEIEGRVTEALEDGVEVIIGDSFSTTYAEKLGLRSILILSGKEAVINSLHEADLMAYYTSREREKNKYLTVALDQEKENLIIIDSKYHCYFISKNAKEILGVERKNMSGVNLSDLGPEFAELKKKIEMNPDTSFYLFEIQNKEYHIETHALMENEQQVGIKIKFIEGKKIGTFNLLDAPKSEANMITHFNHFVRKSQEMERVIEIAQKLSKSSEPFFIYGEKGTGKRKLVEVMHNESVRKTLPFYYINCQAYSSGKLQRLLFGSGGMQGFPGVFERALGGTVYLDRIEVLSPNLQLKIKEMLQTRKVTREYETQKRLINARIIGGSLQKLEYKVSDGNLDPDLCKIFNRYTINIPPLREHREDIEDLIRWFVVEYNQKFGRQIVGLAKNVSEFLREYSWPENISQLKHTIEEMCELSKGPFIEEGEVNSILLNLQRIMKRTRDSKIEVSNKSLKQIEFEAIHKVIELENYNQSNAAKKLKISRSTLWRKVNEDL